MERHDSIFDTSPTIQATNDTNDPFGMFSQQPASTTPEKVPVSNDDPFSIFGGGAAAETSDPVYSTVDKSKKSLAPEMAAISEHDDWDAFA